jgi:hypothetical protein
MLYAGFLLDLSSDIENGGDMFLRNYGLYDVITHKIKLFLTKENWENRPKFETGDSENEVKLLALSLHQPVRCLFHSEYEHTAGK